MSVNILESILVNNRDDIVPYLQISRYETIVKDIMDIETVHHTIPNSWQILMQGMIRTENAKYRALYELPTLELIHVLYKLLQLYNIKMVDELCAGQGLLSKLLMNITNNDHIHNIIVIPSDSHSWSETCFFEKSYTQVKSMFINEFTRSLQEQKEQYDCADRAIITAWNNITTERDILKLLQSNKIGTYFYIGDEPGKKCISKNVYNAILQLGYNAYHLTPKQICCFDYYVNNKLTPKNSSKSNLIVFTKNNNYTKEQIINFCGVNNFFQAYPGNIDKLTSFKITIQDLAISEYALPWMCDSMLSDHEFVQCVKLLFNILDRIKKKIPKWIPDYQTFTFWANKTMERKFPLLINDTNNLIKYKTLITNLDKKNYILVYQFQKQLPLWIFTKEIAEMYFWVDFSTNANDKGWKNGRNWKEEYNNFTNKFVYLSRYR